MPVIHTSTPRRRAIARRTGRLAVGLAIVATMVPALAAGAQPLVPHLELRSGTNKAVVEKYPGEPVYLDLGIHVAAIGGPFEVWLTRPDYAQPIEVAQKIYRANGNFSFQSLPADAADGWEGFADFLRVDVSQDGELVKSKTLTFCPNSYERQRVSDAGPIRPSYPDGCYGSVFAKGLVWGIDQDWAVNATGAFESSMRLRKGTYDVTVSIEPRYVDLFDVPDGARTAEVQLEVKKLESSGCRKCPPKGGARPPDAKSLAGVPTVTDPDPSTLPDLVALPALGHQRRERP